MAASRWQITLILLLLSGIFLIAGSAPAFNVVAGFPDRVFAPYVDVCIYPRFLITNQNQAMGTKYYTLAFVISDSGGNGIPTWGGYMEYATSGDWYRDEINGIRARGGDVIVSFGGAAGTELALAHDSVDSLRSAYQSVINTYSLTWVDFDIEGAAVTDSPSIDRRNKAIKILQDNNPGLKIAYCLPVLPSGLTQAGINLMQNALDNNVRVDLVNIMAMDYGDGAAPDPAGKMGEYAIEAAESLFDQLATLHPEKTGGEIWRMIGITPMIGRNDILSEVFDPEDTRQLLSFAREKNISLISMWSANRDNGSCGAAAYSSPLCSSLEQEDYAFSAIFDQFTGTAGPPTPIPTATPPATPKPTATGQPDPTPSRERIPIISNGDYNGDGAADIAIFRPLTGLWAIRGVSRCYFGSSEDIPASGDYNGDGTAQIAIFRPATGLWAIRDQGRIYFGGRDDTPIPADYNGDGIDDIAICRPATGLWAVHRITRVYFGIEGDRPLPGDYSGAGTAAIAIFRPSSGLWSIRGEAPVYFGGQADTPVPADYDGDGETDLAIFRSATGLWAIKDLTRSYFGTSNDAPVPADYDGDGEDDIALFRETAGYWAVRGVTRAYYGSSGDIPVAQ